MITCKSTTHFFIAIAVSLLMFSAVAVSQVPPPTPKPTTPIYTKPKEKDKPPKVPIPGAMPPNIEMGDGTTTERSLAVDARISVSLCVTQGTVKVNGWKRNEVRAFVSEGSKFGFRILQKSMKGEPALISLVGVKKL